MKRRRNHDLGSCSLAKSLDRSVVRVVRNPEGLVYTERVMHRAFMSVVVSVAAASALMAPVRAEAQQEVQVAATAFAEGQQAQLRGDYVRAAELFEIADQSVPSAAALRSAIRMRGVAGHDVRAATLALQALQRYPEDAETQLLAESALQRSGPKLTRIALRCSEPCTATVDGALVGAGPLISMEFFVSPGSHVIRGAWPGREPVSKSIESTAGQTQHLELRAPQAAPVEKPSAPPVTPAPPVATTVSFSDDTRLRPVMERRSGMSPAVFWIGTALTAGAGAATWWSGRDTLSARDDYEEDPTRSGYEDGVELERRTNVLIGATALLGVTTIGIGLFATDWGGSSEVGLSVTGDQASLSLSGRMP
jgi:hypothetical protein